MSERDVGTGGPWSDAPVTLERQVLRDLGFFGHYLYWHAGGRGGKHAILVLLLLNGGRLPQREVLERSHITSAALSEVLAKLESEGLIARTRSAQDRRQLDVVLTQEGEACARDMLETKRRFEADSLSVLTEEEKRELQSLLERVRAHWEERENMGRETECRSNSNRG